MSDSDYRSSLQEVATALSGCRRLLVISGAGMSADSGLPTYRGIGGLYEGADTEEGIPIEVALSGEMLCTRPAVTWKYLHQVESACRGCGPHRGHEVLARWESRFDGFCLLTQNIDGFHQRAGSHQVIPIHGDVHQLRCTRCRHQMEVVDYAELAPLPRCPACDGLLRPAVVLFGEMLPSAPLAQLQAFLSEVPDVVISIGTTSVFPYIAGPVFEAQRAGALTVEINPGESEVSSVVGVRLRRGAAEVLADLDALLQAS